MVGWSNRNRKNREQYSSPSSIDKPMTAAEWSMLAIFFVVYMSFWIAMASIK